MSYMDNGGDFAFSGDVQELSFHEIDQVLGGKSEIITAVQYGAAYVHYVALNILDPLEILRFSDVFWHVIIIKDFP